MKLKHISPLFLALAWLLFYSCTTTTIIPEFERIPAGTESLFDTVFTINGGEVKAAASENLKSFSNEQLSSHAQAYKGVRTEILPAKNLSLEKPFKIEIDVDQKKNEYIYRIYHHPQAFKDKSATYSMIDFVKSMIEGENLVSHNATYEMYYNAREGDLFALRNFLRLKEGSNHLISMDSTSILESDEFKKRKEKNDLILSELEKEIDKYKAWQKKETDKRKAPLAALDKAGDDKQFRTLVAKGDRKGAAKLLRTYLPWEMMAPFEKQFWETYLEVMANPVPLEQRVMIYRGLEGDFVHSGFSKGVALSQKEAILQDNAFVMSTVLVKNQGSWNRRLRSLESMHTKTIALVNGTNFENAQPARITTIFNNHAGVPQGSPFLSFSPSFSVASSFGSERISAYLIDPRLLSYNYEGIMHEVEFLLPLTTFPEDLIGIADNKLHNLQSYDQQPRIDLLNAKMVQKIEKAYGKDKAEAIINKIKKNSYDFFHTKMTNMQVPKVPITGAANKKFYKTLGEETFKPALNEKGELTCKDILQLFWVTN